MLVFNAVTHHSYQGEGRNYSIAVFGVQKDPLYLSAFLMPPVAVGLIRYLSDQAKFRRINLLCGGVIVAACIFSGTRTALVSLMRRWWCSRCC